MIKYFLGLSLVLFCFSCSSRSHIISVLQEDTTVYNWSTVKTIGNHSYIPINRKGTPADLSWDILRIQHEFEKQHPGVKITWQIEARYNECHESYGVDYVYGLWASRQ